MIAKPQAAGGIVVCERWMSMIEIGEKAPGFDLPDQDGKRHALKDYKGKYVVLYFYPKDDTSGCTVEACDFRDRSSKFSKIDAMVFGVSPDDVKSHGKFAGKFDLSFPLLADVPGDDGLPAVCDSYGVWQEKSMYGRKYMGVVRTTYLIDPKGVVVKRWDQVKVEGHGEVVLREVLEQRVQQG